MLVAPGTGFLSIDRKTMCNAVQPVRERLALANRAGLARQDSPSQQTAAAFATAVQPADAVESLTPSAALAAYALGPSSALDITI